MIFCGIINQNQIFAIIGRDEIQSNIKEFPNNLVLISITDPNTKDIETNNKFKDELKLKFWDLEEQYCNYMPISISQGLEIYNFIMKHKNETFLINCEAGISRSAGVGLAIEYLLRDKYIYPKWEHFPSKILNHFRYLPNHTVFNRIICHSNLK